MIFLEGALLTGLFFLLFITFVLVRNRFQFKGIADSDRSEDSELSVAICIPARNEEKVIRACLDLALSQNYRNTQVYVLDDRSTDRTPQILEEFQARYPDTLTIVRGKQRPEGWLGKPYACHQLSEVAREDILIFVDADTWMQPEVVSRVVGAFNRNNIDFITIWPEQRLYTFWEKVVVPLVYYALLGLLPVAYTERKPRWMPAYFHEKYRSLFAAACGQFMAFRAETYRQIDGHEAVKNHIVEDVMLAREVIDHGFRMRMLHGRDAFFCRMYTSERGMFEGFRKNFLAGFDYNIPLFVVMAVMHFVSFLLPLLVLAAAIFLPVSGTAVGISAVMVLLFTLHRIMLASWMRWESSYAFLHVFGVGWFQRLGLITLTDYLMGRSISWKGDDIRHPK
ncbi:chlorobactene glucosyltransferase [Cyclonatronum proteinivorum]|uniref:Chlorobactene glucosyltransferase n=1 Tax=Cyclonatronum proteinivorum TaxID=1457365 RepID=A0A345UL41_9BACT|nr:glycosyltransferase family 2 protein [Cyclonatronum proteinivorum]AXJ01193.1 chlorobactene glucosyltransferase [Cyclonatronum proteinivorum]